MLIAQLVMLLETLLSCVRYRTRWPLTLALQSLRGNQQQIESLATYAAEMNESKPLTPKPFWRSIPMANPTPIEPTTAEFIGGPLDGKRQQLSEPLPSFTWANVLPNDWIFFRDKDEYNDQPVQVEEYTYERQGYYSSHGNAVYLCTTRGEDV